MSEITHSVTCDACGRETFAWERYCHECGADRWSDGGDAG